MPVKLIVRNLADPSFTEEHVFRQDCITIGRDTANLLPLPDDRRIVSKQHAEIRVEQGGMEVVDLGSKNYTYVNDQQLRSRQPSDLKHGDVLRVGEFEIQVALLEPEVPKEPEVVAPADDRTVFAVNPFWEQAEALKALLGEIGAAYRREVPGRRREALLEAFSEALEDEVDSEVVTVLNDVLGGAESPSAPDIAAPGAGAHTSPSEVAERETGPEHEEPPSYWEQLVGSTPAEAPGEPAPRRPAPQEASTPPLANAADPDEVVSLLLEYVAELLGIPWQFRHEFIGQTIVQSGAASVLYDGDAESLARFLLDPSLTDEEAARRRTLLADASDALRRHQVALVDGYRAAVRDGVQRFLEEIDLDEIREELSGKASWYERPFVRLRALRALEEKVGELRNEEWTVIERRVFRPAFIKAYLARMTSS